MWRLALETHLTSLLPMQVNSIIKSHVQYKSNQLMDFVGKLKEVIDEQQKEIVICRGKYRFKDHLTVNETSW